MSLYSSRLFEDSLGDYDFSMDYEDDLNPRALGVNLELDEDLSLRYDGKLFLTRIRVIQQSFALWAKTHIANCKPNQDGLKFGKIKRDRKR